MAADDEDDSPSVMGGMGGVPSLPPSRADAEQAWRRLFAARLVERDVLDVAAAEDCAAAVDVDLSTDPIEAADVECEYWDSD